MGWSIGYDSNWKRDIGYGVPATCDHPKCRKRINRGLSYVCGGEPYGGEHGCGLFFCWKHLYYAKHKKGQLCERCVARNEDGEPEPFEPKPDLKMWLRWKLTHKSWKQWREETPDEVAALRRLLA